jgi:L-ascorbate metabolism protein UlaG (beta-lactamase superfamily)
MKPVNFLLLLIALTCFSGSAIPDPSEAVRVTLVTDQGVMIRSANISILVDGLDDNIRRDLLNGEPPFSAVDMVFISHGHTDHFRPEIAREFLRNHPESALAVAPRLAADIREGFDDYARISKQIRILEAHKGSAITVGFSKIEGQFIEFNHAVSPLFPESVISFIVELGDMKLFYLGEAEMTSDQWLQRDMRSDEIDVVILPYWTFKEQMTRAVISSRIAPGKTLAIMDVGQAVDEGLRKLPDGLGQVHFLNGMMQTVEID